MAFALCFVAPERPCFDVEHDRQRTCGQLRRHRLQLVGRQGRFLVFRHQRGLIDDLHAGTPKPDKSGLSGYFMAWATMNDFLFAGASSVCPNNRAPRPVTASKSIGTDE